MQILNQGAKSMQLLAQLNVDRFLVSMTLVGALSLAAFVARHV